MAHGLASLALALSLSSLVPAAASACGPDSDCVIGERTYRIALPDGDGPFGAIMYMHGYRGSAAGAMANGAFRQMANDIGVALIAAKSGAEDWLIRNAPRKGFADDHRELAYFDAVLEDVTGRFPVDGERILATGFSAGGMMTWTLACHRGPKFAGFLPVAGTFWAPLPEDCAFDDVNLIHVHGTADRIVPLAGRPIADTHQGDVDLAVAMLTSVGDYQPNDALANAPPGLSCTARANAASDLLGFCLHDGGHSIRAEWLAWGYRTLVGAP